MSHLFRLARFALLPLAIALSTAGCHKNPALVLADNNQAGTQDPASDPATANLPPVADNSGAPGYASKPLPATSRAHRRRTRSMPLQSPASLRTIQVTESSLNTPLPSRLRPCPTTTSRRFPATTISGRPATGPGLRTATTGCPAHGSRLPTRARSGPPATGATGMASTGFTLATGASTSATMAASTTASVTLASATRAVTGAAATSTTTAPTTTSTSASCITCTVPRSRSRLQRSSWKLQSAQQQCSCGITIHAPATVADRAASSPIRNRQKELRGTSRPRPA